MNADKIVIVDWLWNDGGSPSPGGEAWVHVVDVEALLAANEEHKGWSGGGSFKTSDLDRNDMGDVYGSNPWHSLIGSSDLWEEYEVFKEHEANLSFYRKLARSWLGPDTSFVVKEWGTRADSPFSDPDNEWDEETETWKT